MNSTETVSETDAALSRYSRELLLDLYSEMLLMRRFEETVSELYTVAKVYGFVHLNVGEEAAVLGAIGALRLGDYVYSTYRDHGHALAKGCEPRSVMAELMGKEAGVSRGRGGSMHLFCAKHRFMGGYAIVGGSMPLAVGAALAIDYRGGDEVVMCVFGDGTTNIGAFHESLNLAAVWDLPVVFVCINNQYGMGTAIARASAITELWKKSGCYGIPGQRVDGMDVIAVRDAASEAIDKTRREHIPTFLEVVTYRYRGHSMSDAARYRTREELQRWRERDAIGTFETRLLEAGLVQEEELQAPREKVEAQVRDAVEFGDASPAPKVEELEHYVYAGAR